ncbi:site-specific recombinase XerD [Hydrogenispora ethanolica]|uniref:Site-specific recombinase XerD n=1 Tax=Hydrogenispora ethanolica TaxID=1082276 RepID=A0A4R1RZV4_HYDET|nr:site-specific integrase [Hydrogenispora ethanolica]TCL72341.1 site-specific recombinase XerD [Hydrogenispora ethanolica]
MEQWEEYLNLYLKHKKSLKLAPRTISDAQYHVTNLFKGKSVDFHDFRFLRKLVIEYFADNDNISPVTFNTRRKNLNTFFNWLVSEEIIEKSPTKSIKKAREDRTPRHTSSDVITMILKACNCSTYEGLRDYICIALSYDTGIRPSEMELLPYSCFDLEKNELTIPANIAKTRISRTLPFNEKLVPLIEQLHQYQLDDNWDENIPFFSNKNKTPLNRFSWRRRLMIYSNLIGVKITPYMIRHSAAIAMIRNNANAFHVQSMLGHTNLNTTKIYISLATSDLKEVHALTSPLDKVI